MDLWQSLTFTLKASMRAIDTAFVASKRSLSFLLNSLWSKENIAPRELRMAFEELGATYIKLGQLIASAPSLFPRAYVEEFQKCLDNVGPLPFRTIKEVIESELGGPMDKFFRSVDTKPLASASIAQVHRAVLHTGAQVVLKVQRPGVDSQLEMDMTFLSIAAQAMEKIVPEFSRTSISAIVEDFHKVMREEIDFLSEAKNVEKFDEFLEQIGEEKAIVPWVYWDTTTKKLLTLEYLDGVALTDLDSIRSITDKPEEMLLTALNVWYQSLAMCDFFHADVHAGNLLALKDGRVAFIDFGIVGRIPKQVWMGLLLLMQAMTINDYRMMAEALAQTGATHDQVDVEKFAKDLEKIFSKLRPDDPQHIFTLSEVEMNGLIMDMAEAGERYGIRFPRAFALLMKQMLYFDRYVSILAPDLDILRDQRLELPRALQLK